MKPDEKDALVEYLKDWIKDCDFDLTDLIPEDQLTAWAENNGFVKEEEEKD